MDESFRYNDMGRRGNLCHVGQALFQTGDNDVVELLVYSYENLVKRISNAVQTPIRCFNPQCNGVQKQKDRCESMLNFRIHALNMPTRSA
jgi:hypothetical protein